MRNIMLYSFKLSNLGRDFPIKTGNNHVKRVQTTKYLGIHLDENLKGTVSRLCARASVNPPANGNKSNAKKSRFCPNRNLKGTIYHWSIILRSFSVVLNPAKRDANGFFKILLLSSHLLISRHPVQNSKFGACAVTGYCSEVHDDNVCWLWKDWNENVSFVVKKET